jgi:glycosyltransferase involved in cell wall biosynthesis
MACGVPVVATRVWGSPEVVAAPEAGVLCEERSGVGIARAISALLAAYPSRNATRLYAERFSWQATTEGQLALFESLHAIPGQPSQAAARGAIR